jgi:hypothetical protein
MKRIALALISLLTPFAHAHVLLATAYSITGGQGVAACSAPHLTATGTQTTAVNGTLTTISLIYSMGTATVAGGVDTAFAVASCAEKREAEKKTEDDLEEEAPEGTGDKARKAKDSAYLVDSFQATIALAEIIQPGIKIPTYDAKANPKATYDSLCAFRRTVLASAAGTTDTAEIVSEVNGGRAVTSDSLKKMSCDRVRTLFNGVGAAVKLANTTDRGPIAATRDGEAKPLTLVDLRKKNEEFWAAQR